MTLSVVIIAFNEEENLPRTLKSVEGLVRALGGEIVVVDSGSTDRTVEIAKSFGAKVFIEEWKGFAAQKNSAIDKATGTWILSLDADEEISSDFVEHVRYAIQKYPDDELEYRLPRPADAPPIADTRGLRQLPNAFYLPRRNYFMGRWIRHGGFYPDKKLRFFARGVARFDDHRLVHEDPQTRGPSDKTGTPYVGHIIHHAYPTLSGYIDHMNRYSSLGAEMAGPRSFSFIDIFIRPSLTFFYNYFLRLGFLDGREGFLLHLYHSVYVSWKYAKAWELSRQKKQN